MIDISHAPTPRWDDFVLAASDATVMHLSAWKLVMEQAYGHRTFFLSASTGDTLRGVLPLVLMNGALTGRHLVSMPFMDYGGACVHHDDEAETALVDAACQLAGEHRARLTLRYLRQPTLSLPSSLEKVTMFFELPGDEEALWKRLPADRRNRIRKGLKEGLSATTHASDGLPDFYTVFATNMRDLGSPVHARSFFEHVLRHLERHTRILIVRHQDRPIGAALMLLFRDVISIPWISSLRPFFGKYPNQVLYWEAMRFGVANGFRVLDFGRSSKDSGGYEAKRQWGASPVQLYWHYYPAGAAPPSEDVKRLGWGAQLWKRLPLPVANLIGPPLRRNIPN